MPSFYFSTTRFVFIFTENILFMRYFMILFFGILTVNTTFSAVYFCDPVNGNISNNGTFSQPWSSLQDVMNTPPVSFNAGDTLFLLSGNHGNVNINGVVPGNVTILSYPNHNPVCQSIAFGNSSATAFWIIKGITVQSENTQTYPGWLIDLSSSTSNITIENCIIQSSGNTSSWWRSDWRNRCKNGISVKGNTHSIKNNTITNIAIGILYEGNYCSIENNEISNFTIDAVRITQSNLNFIHNYIHDNITVFTYTENHYDGIQFYTCCPVGQDTIKNVKIARNTIINTTDTTRKYNGLMQGIGGFDGWFSYISITNNVIIIDNWHGITLAGADNCFIVNNTLIDPYVQTQYDSLETQQSGNVGPCWIRITQHKNGTPSFNDNLVRNNLVPVLANDNNIGTVDYNILLSSINDYPNYFVNYYAYDLHLIPGAAAIDSGYYAFAPTIDLDSVSRPQGNSVDIGAYEYFPVTGITDYLFANTPQITVYPNPVYQLLTIESNVTITQAQVYSVTGKQLLEKDIFNNSFYLDLSNFSKGVYFIRLLYFNGVWTKKIVKS